MLRELDVPCLVYAGNADDRAHASAEQSVEDTRNTSCVSVPGSDHLQGMSRIDVVLPHVKKLWHAFSRESQPQPPSQDAQGCSLAGSIAYLARRMPREMVDKEQQKRLKAPQ